MSDLSSIRSLKKLDKFVSSLRDQDVKVGKLGKRKVEIQGKKENISLQEIVSKTEILCEQSNDPKVKKRVESILSNVLALEGKSQPKMFSLKKITAGVRGFFRHRSESKLEKNASLKEDAVKNGYSMKVAKLKRKLDKLATRLDNNEKLTTIDAWRTRAESKEAPIPGRKPGERFSGPLRRHSRELRARSKARKILKQIDKELAKPPKKADFNKPL